MGWGRGGTQGACTESSSGPGEMLPQLVCQHRLPYLRPVDHGLHADGRRGVHRRAVSGWRALPAGRTPDG